MRADFMKIGDTILPAFHRIKCAHDTPIASEALHVVPIQTSLKIVKSNRLKTERALDKICKRVEYDYVMEECDLDKIEIDTETVLFLPDNGRDPDYMQMPKGSY